MHKVYPFDIGTHLQRPPAKAGSLNAVRVVRTRADTVGKSFLTPDPWFTSEILPTSSPRVQLPKLLISGLLFGSTHPYGNQDNLHKPSTPCCVTLAHRTSSVAHFQCLLYTEALECCKCQDGHGKFRDIRVPHKPQAPVIRLSSRQGKAGYRLNGRNQSSFPWRHMTPEQLELPVSEPPRCMGNRLPCAGLQDPEMYIALYFARVNQWYIVLGSRPRVGDSVKVEVSLSSHSLILACIVTGLEVAIPAHPIPRSLIRRNPRHCSPW